MWYQGRRECCCSRGRGRTRAWQLLNKQDLARLRCKASRGNFGGACPRMQTNFLVKIRPDHTRNLPNVILNVAPVHWNRLHAPHRTQLNHFTNQALVKLRPYEASVSVKKYALHKVHAQTFAEYAFTSPIDVGELALGNCARSSFGVAQNSSTLSKEPGLPRRQDYGRVP